MNRGTERMRWTTSASWTICYRHTRAARPEDVGSRGSIDDDVHNGMWNSQLGGNRVYVLACSYNVTGGLSDGEEGKVRWFNTSLCLS